MKKSAIILVLSSLAVFTALDAEQSLGIQADMVGQGIAYRYLLPSGFGAEIVGRGRYDLTEKTYDLGGELRLLKHFDTYDRLRIFLGLGGGGWQFKEKYWEWVGYDEDSNYVYEERIRTQTGISAVALVGLDLIVFQMGENSGLSIAPEFQFGYYSMPRRIYYVERGESLDDYEPSRLISPGVGIGLRYFW